MGGDGGVIAVKRKFIKECRVDKDELDPQKTREVLMSKAFTCSISGEPLVDPVVCCRLGYLYSKENILSALLDKRLNETFSHVKRMKDIKTLVFTPNTEYNEQSSETSSAKYICPITQTPFDGLHKFVAIWSTGFVISEKALREIGAEGLQSEYGPFTADDVVGLLPGDEELSHRRAELEARLEIEKLAKSKKRRAVVGEHVEETGLDLEKRHRAEADGKKVSGMVPPRATVGVSSAIATSARAAVADSEGKSDVFKTLFHTDADAKTSSRDLLMSVAGFRYTLS